MADSVTPKAPVLHSEVRPDGTILVTQEGALGPYPRCITERFMQWAEQRPEQVWMAERDGQGGWTKMTYAEGARAIRAIGSALLARGLGPDRPLLILSGNSLSHAVMALGAQHVGVPSAALSPAYALASDDHGKLAAIVEQLTPGLVFADHAAAYLKAIDAVLPADVPLVSITGQSERRETLRFGDLVTGPATSQAAEAHAAITGETVAKFLFTSGTTGSPKTVIQTQKMLCSNQEMVAQAYDFLAAEPPILMDWAPWNHTAAGNKVFNMAIYHGGTYYVDDGRPTPDMIGRTIRNLREVAPTWYFNVPIGYQFLLEAMEADDALAATFFSRLKMLMYAGAGMSLDVWQRLMALAEAKIPGGVPIVSGLGSTETGPFALYYTEKKDKPGNIGIPALDVVLKLVPQDGKLEARLKSPSITPGYWRDAKLSAEAFDEEGFYRLGDALRYAEPGNPAAGFLFDGRLAENFKLATGTWVAVGALRAGLVNALGGLASDAVIAGEGHDDLRALLIPNLTEMRAAIAAPEATLAELCASAELRALLQARLSGFAKASTGSASRVVAAMILPTALSFARGEVTDKGSVNQRAVLRERAGLIEALWQGGAELITAEWKR
jgi:feruloyl-CoA synthase